MKTRLKNLYDCFYTPPEFSEQKQEMEECHQALIEVPKMPEMKEVITPEEEKSEATLQELVEEADIVPEPSPAQAPPESELQAPSEQNATPQQEPEPAPAPDSEPDNMVYVPGFGWIESQGPNHAEYAEDMYENGNKIGIMG